MPKQKTGGLGPPFLLAVNNLPGSSLNSAVFPGLPHSFSDGLCRLRMEDGRYDVFRRQFFLWDQVRQRVDGGHEHGVCDLFGAGNMTPTYRVLPDGTVRPVYFYMVDTSEFAANKLGDRGSLTAKGIVTNVQDFMTNVCKGLGL